MSPGRPKWHGSIWRGELIALIELIDRISLVDAIGLIASITSIDTVTLVEAITAIGRIKEIQMANIRNQILMDPGFEEGTLMYWPHSAQTHIETTSPYEGDYCVRMEPEGTLEQAFPPILARSLSFQLWVKAEELDDFARVRILFTDATYEEWLITGTTSWITSIYPSTSSKTANGIRIIAKAENVGDMFIDYITVMQVPSQAVDDSGRGLGLPYGQYLETPPTLSDEEYHPLTLTSSGQLRTYDPLAATQATLEEVQGALDVPPLDAVMALLLDEGSGTTAYDASLEENNGTISGATWKVSKRGMALSLDGSDDFVNCGASMVDVHDSFSWVVIFTASELPSVSGEDKYVMTKEYNRIEVESSAGGHVDEIRARLVGTPNIVLDSGVKPIVVGQAYHVVFTYDGTTGKLYVDGALKDSDDSTVADKSAYSLLLGEDWLHNCNFKGFIHEARVYDRELTATEALALYESSRREVEALIHPKYGLPNLYRMLDDPFNLAHMVSRMTEEALTYFDDPWWVCRINDVASEICSLLLMNHEYDYGTYQSSVILGAALSARQVFYAMGFEHHHGWPLEGIIDFKTGGDLKYWCENVTGGSSTSTEITGTEAWEVETVLKWIWGVGSVAYYTGGVLRATHNTDVPADSLSWFMEVITGDPTPGLESELKQKEFEEL